MENLELETLKIKNLALQEKLRIACEALEAVAAAKCFDSCAHPQSVWWNIWVQQPAAKALALINKTEGGSCLR